MKKIITHLLALNFALVTGFSVFLFNTVQGQINYQGLLTDTTGAPLEDGQYIIEFSLWDDITGGTQIWGPYSSDGTTGDGHGPLADVVGGRFNVIIGQLDANSDSLTNAMASSDSLYLQIKVGEDDPISPRQVILPAPRALLADVIPNVVPTVDGVTISGDLSTTGVLNVTGGVANLGDQTGNTKLVLQESNSDIFGLGTSDNQFRMHTGSSDDKFSFLDAPEGNELFTILGNGNVGIGNSSPSDKLRVEGTFSAWRVNGQNSPHSFQIGTKNNNSNWHQHIVDSSTIKSYLGDEDGGSVRFLISENNTDRVWSILVHIYMEQDSISTDNSSGVHMHVGTSSQDHSYVLQTSSQYDLGPTWFGKVRMRNYESKGLTGLPSGSNGSAFNDYRIAFLVQNNYTVKVIIYDR